jgi:hypothetical protein
MFAIRPESDPIATALLKLVSGNEGTMCDLIFSKKYWTEHVAVMSSVPGASNKPFAQTSSIATIMDVIGLHETAFGCNASCGWKYFLIKCGANIITYGDLPHNRCTYVAFWWTIRLGITIIPWGYLGVTIFCHNAENGTMILCWMPTL